MNVVAAISASLSKSNDTTERIITAEACNAALEELGTDVEFSKQSVKVAAAEYGKIAAKILFVAADSTDDTDANSNNGAASPLLSRIIDRYRRSVEVFMPGVAIAFGCIILATTVIGLGNGIASAGPQATTAQLVLSPSQVRSGNTYFTTASGFSPSEIVQFSWVGPTHGTMGAAPPPVDSGGNATDGPIVESDPPGNTPSSPSGKHQGVPPRLSCRSPRAATKSIIGGGPTQRDVAQTMRVIIGRGSQIEKERRCLPH
ncbi:MAG: hypothetical protein WAU83_00995 [Pseudonocardiaceae bacterium]